MKDKLAILDFDETIKENVENVSGPNIKDFFPNRTYPPDIQELIDAKNWDAYHYKLADHINTLNNVSKKDIIDAWNNGSVFVQGMDEVIKKLAEDVIIITGNYSEKPKCFLQKHGLLEYVQDVIGKPTEITDDGKMTVHPCPQDWGGPCRITGRAICKVSVLRHFAQRQNYEKIIYIGDGKNDLCPALNLGKNDVVCPRKGYALISLLEKYCIQAQIVPWDNGIDLLQSLEKL